MNLRRPSVEENNATPLQRLTATELHVRSFGGMGVMLAESSTPVWCGSTVGQSRRCVHPHKSTVQWLDALLWCSVSVVPTSGSFGLYQHPPISNLCDDHDDEYASQFYHHQQQTTVCYPTRLEEEGSLVEGESTSSFAVITYFIVIAVFYSHRYI